jgi:hypothetical protein
MKCKNYLLSLLENIPLWYEDVHTHPNRNNRGGAYQLGARYGSVTSFKRNLPLLMKRGGIDCKRIKKDNKPWEIELNRECCGF